MTEINQDKIDTTTKALKGVHSQTIIVVLKGVIALCYFSIMSRLLSPDDFGLFALITAVTTIFMSLSEAGLGSAVIQRKNANQGFVSTAFTLSMILGLCFSGILFLFSSFFSKITTGHDTLSLAFKIMSIMMILQAGTNISWSIYMRNLDFFKFGILQISADLLSYITGIILAYKGLGYYAIVCAVVSNQLFLTLILICMRKYYFKINIERKYIKDIIGYGGWLTAAVVVRNFTNEMDKIIIGRLLPISTLGELNRPQGFISRISTQVNSVVDTVLFPIISDIQDDKDKISRGYLKIISLVITFSFILGSTISLGSKIIIDIFFGSQWLHLQLILSIFAFTMILHGFSRVADSFFRSLGIVKKYFFARLINWIILMTFVIIGCQFGITGAAIAISSGTLVSCLIKFLMQKKEVGISLKELSKVVLRSTVAPFIILVFSLCVRLFVPQGEYLGVGAFLILTIVSFWFYPNMYSSIFRSIIISRYLKR